MRKLISLFAALILTVHMTSCTSNDSKDDASGDEAIAAETAGTDAELEALDAPPPASDPSVAATDGANEGFLDDQLPEDALGEKTAKTDAPPAGALDAPPAADAPLTIEEPKKDATADAGFDPPIEAAPTDSSIAAVDPGTSSLNEPLPSETSPAPDMGSSMAGVSDTPPAPPMAESKPKASLQKVEAAPLTRAGVLLNAVYVARPGDNYKKISQMIYGNAKKEKELKKANKSVSKPRPGDKIYYNSPVRPTDDTKLLTYYEDSGMVPEVYVAQEGDDLKKVAKKILGYDNAWKEVWATNTVDSKGALTAGTELRYWKSAPVAATTETIAPPTEVAANSTPAEMAPPPMPEMPPAPPAEMAPPVPPAEMAPPVAQNELPPPPPAEMAPPPPPQADLPPPPPAEAVNPPPPPAIAKKAEPAMGEGGLDNDMIMTLAGVGIVALGAFALIISRKRRQSRDAAVAFNDTQVGT